MKAKGENKKYCEEIYRLKFVAKTRKDAYFKACTWYAKNVLSNDELQDIHCEYIKDKQSPSVTICLYIAVIEDNIRVRHCQICKESHNMFFMNDKYNCDKCNLKAYQLRADQGISIKKEHYKKLLLENGVI